MLHELGIRTGVDDLRSLSAEQLDQMVAPIEGRAERGPDPLRQRRARLGEGGVEAVGIRVVGGNDGHNTVVPLTQSEFNAYKSARGSVAARAAERTREPQVVGELVRMLGADEDDGAVNTSVGRSDVGHDAASEVRPSQVTPSAVRAFRHKSCCWQRCDRRD